MPAKPKTQKAKAEDAILDAAAAPPPLAPITTTPALAIEMWPVDKPVDYPKNARKWSEHAIEKVAASIREFGFRQPIVVDPDGVIVIGHLRRVAARTLGMAEVPVHVAADLSPAQIKGLRIADNRTNEESTWDMELLGNELLEMSGMGCDLLLTGFELSQIDALLIQAGAPAPAGGHGGTGNPTLAERFGVPPFSVLDARQGYWQDRKRAWLMLGIQSELGRGDASPGGSPRPACDYSNNERGDGTGKAIAGGGRN